MSDEKAHAEPLTLVPDQSVEAWSCLNGMENSESFGARRQHRTRLERLFGWRDSEPHSGTDIFDQLAQHATQQAALRAQIEGVSAQLRHAYQQLMAQDERWSRRGMRQFADGLISPQIRKLEQLAQSLGEPPEPDHRTEYCGVALVGGWCKRRRGHRGDHACS